MIDVRTTRKGTMDYPGYRKKGWPMASSSVESACGQMGERVKHARMRWTRRRAEAVHQVKAAVLSQDGRPAFAPGFAGV